MPLDHERELIEISDGNIGGLHSLIEESKRLGYNFTALRLFTDNAGASAFYEKLGFKQTEEYKASHFITLPVQT